MGDGIDPVPGLNVFLGDRGRADAASSGRDRADGGISPSARCCTHTVVVDKITDRRISMIHCVTRTVVRHSLTIYP